MDPKLFLSQQRSLHQYPYASCHRDVWVNLMQCFGKHISQKLFKVWYGNTFLKYKRETDENKSKIMFLMHWTRNRSGWTKICVSYKRYKCEVTGNMRAPIRSSCSGACFSRNFKLFFIFFIIPPNSVLIHKLLEWQPVPGTVSRVTSVVTLTVTNDPCYR